MTSRFGTALTALLQHVARGRWAGMMPRSGERPRPTLLSHPMTRNPIKSAWQAIWPAGRPPARLPDGLRIYAIGDIHGRADLLAVTLARIDEDQSRSPVARAIEIYLGDYIDRGPHSDRVLELLVARSRVAETVLLKGNHEAYLMDFLRRPDTLSDWRHFGGLQTLMSYRLAPSINPDAAERRNLSMQLRQILPFSHRAFLNRLVPSFSCGEYFFAHAGVRPGIPLSEQTEEDLLWIREDFLFCYDQYEKVIVHGHTPVVSPEIHRNRINIDTGAYASDRLTGLVLEADDVAFLPRFGGRA